MRGNASNTSTRHKVYSLYGITLSRLVNIVGNESDEAEYSAKR
jgi:hypothetical protein